MNWSRFATCVLLNIASCFSAVSQEQRQQTTPDSNDAQSFLNKPGVDWDDELLWVQLDGWINPMKMDVESFNIPKESIPVKEVFRVWRKLRIRYSVKHGGVTICRNYPAGAHEGAWLPCRLKLDGEIVEFKFSKEKRWSSSQKLIWFRFELGRIEVSLQQAATLRNYESGLISKDDAINQGLQYLYHADRDVALYERKMIVPWIQENKIVGEDAVLGRAGELDAKIALQESFQKWANSSYGKSQRETWLRHFAEKK